MKDIEQIIIPDDEILYIGCHCGAPEHLLRFLYCGVDKMNDEYDEQKLIYTHIFLEPKKFLWRLWLGIKYICGFKTKSGSGHFTEIVLNNTECKKMIDFFNSIYKFDNAKPTVEVTNI